MPLRRIGKYLLYGLAAIVVLVLVSLLAAKLALDRVPQYQAQIKGWVHERFGYHIAFAHVSPAFRWYGPELYFTGLELRSKDDRRVLAQSASGRVGLDIWHLLHRGRLLGGRIELDMPMISVIRLPSGQFALADAVVPGHGEALPVANTLDDLPAGSLVIRRGRVSVRDWNPTLPLLELTEVNFSLRRGDGAATVSMAARLPAVLGGGVSVYAVASGLGPLSELNWTAVARTERLRLGGWRDLLPDYLTRLEGGSGGFKLAARGRGADLARADLDFDATAVSTQLVDEPSVKFERISGVLTLTHKGDRWAVLGRRVRATREGRSDPDSEFDVSWRSGESGLAELNFRASYLRAETLLPLAGLLPQRELRERLLAAELTGEWLDTRVDMRRAAAAEPWRFTVQAQFRGVGFAPIGRAPGLRGLNGRLFGTESGGRLDLDSRAAVFTWPTQLLQPVALQAVKTSLYWQRNAQELLIATPSLELQNQDANLFAQAAWHMPADGSSPVLSLAASLDDGDVSQTSRYLPRAQIAPPALAWLDRALVGGRMPHADIAIQGPIKHFPFRDGSGVFAATVNLNQVTLEYRSDWPPAENLDGVVEFRNEGMTATLKSGRVAGSALTRANVRFADFKTGELNVSLTAAGDAGGALAFMRATPLDALADHAFSSVDATGPVQADVKLFLPFREFARRRTLVHLALRGVALNRRGSPVSVTEMSGDADVDGAQIARADIAGKLLGGPVHMVVRSPRGQPLVRTVVALSGTASGEPLRSALGLPAGASIGGMTDWHAVFRISQEPTRERSLRVHSTLEGLDLKLPAPLAKAPDTALPSVLDVEWEAGGTTRIHLSLGGVLRAQGLLSDRGEAGSQLTRLSLTFGDGAELPYSETQIVNSGGRIARLDLGGWLTLYPAPKDGRGSAGWFHAARFDVADLDYLGLTFTDLRLKLVIDDGGALHVGVEGPNVVGQLTLPGTARAEEPWKLDFKRLKFAEETVDGGPGGAAAASPRLLPAIDFHADDLVWDDRQFGAVSAALRHLEDGVALKELSVRGGHFSGNASGEWRGREAGVAHVTGTLTSPDVGAALKELGYSAVIEAKQGTIDYNLSWQGAPTAAALRLATGRVTVDFEKGQVTGLNPGAGRVVGLASVAALPRRLALDFSDLTDKGFAFDSAKGHFDIRDGSAFTDDVLVKGPAAEIGLIGRVGFKNKDYDQTAVVTGNVGNTLPLAAFAGGPIIGAAALVFAQVFKQPLKGLVRGYYRITGGWDNPLVERITSAEAAAAETPK